MKHLLFMGIFGFIIGLVTYLAYEFIWKRSK